MEDNGGKAISLITSVAVIELVFMIKKYAIFGSRHTTSYVLDDIFDSRHTTSYVLHIIFSSRHTTSYVLHARFGSRHIGG